MTMMCPKNNFILDFIELFTFEFFFFSMQYLFNSLCFTCFSTDYLPVDLIFTMHLRKLRYYDSFSSDQRGNGDKFIKTFSYNRVSHIVDLRSKVHSSEFLQIFRYNRVLHMVETEKL